MPSPSAIAITIATSRLEGWAIAATGRLPSRRLPIVAKTSVDPQQSAAIRP